MKCQLCGNEDKHGAVFNKVEVCWICYRDRFSEVMKLVDAEYPEIFSKSLDKKGKR